MKVLLISGHGAGDSGAVGCGYKEANLTRQATSILEGKLKAYDVTVTRYPTSQNCYEDLRSGKSVNFAQYALVVEVHFNSASAAAHGEEVLYRSNGSYRYANAVSDAIASVGFTDRGAKLRTDLRVMNTCFRSGVPYILIETCFISNKDDMKLYSKNRDKVWTKVAAAIASQLGVSKPANATKPVEPSKPAQTSEKIAVDGSWGQATTRLAQKVLGTAVDGIVSNQPSSNKRYLPNCSTISWQFKSSGYKAGSSMVRALQRKVGASVDGFCGKNTVKALQKFLDVTVDGSCGSITVKAFQRWLNTKVK